MEKDTKNWIIAILIIFVILFAGAFLIKPAVTGYAVFQDIKKSNVSMEEYEKTIEGFNDELSELSNSVSFYKDLNEKLLGDVKNVSKEIAVCKEDLRKCDRELTNKENTLRDEYEELIQNMANKICCKEKVDDSDIDSYVLEDDEIVCSTKGDNKIECNF